MSAPSFTSFPTPAAPDSCAISSSTTVPKSSNKRDSTSAHYHRHTAKRKKREERASSSSHEAISSGHKGFISKDRVLDQNSKPLSLLNSFTTDHIISRDRFTEAGPSRSEWHYTDAVGERQSRDYGAVASLTCPHYRRDENGRVLGLPRHFRLTKTGDKLSKGLEIAKLGQSYIPRYADRARQTEEHLRFRLEPTGFDPLSDFTLIDSKFNGTTEIAEKENLDTAAAYNPHEAVDVARERIQTFEAHLTSHPEDTSSWIAYSRAHVSVSDGAQHSAQLEVALSILSRALKGSSSFDSISLHLEYMRVAAEIWSSARVEQAWSSILDQFDRDIQSLNSLQSEVFELWLGHLDWAEGSGFGRNGSDVEQVVDLYVQRLAVMSAHGSEDVWEERQLHLFLRACCFLARAGYQERATSAFQAMLDISLSMVDGSLTSNQDFRSVLRDYQDFWDSGWLRLGEDGAEGWQYDNKPHVAGSYEAPVDSTVDLDSDAYRTWYQAERQAERRTNPVRNHESAPDGSDPHETVLFGDIGSLLFPIRNPGSLRHLVIGFLRHMGASIGPPSTTTSWPMYQDPHMIPFNAGAPFWPPPSLSKSRPWQLIAGEAMEPIRNSNFVDLTASPVKSWASSGHTVLNVDWFNDLEPDASFDSSMIKNVLHIYRTRLPDPYYDMMAIAIENTISTRRAAKYTKEILTKEPENITFWAGHARLEIIRGRLDSARAVYANVLAQQTHVSLAEESPTLALWADWARMEWTNGDQGRCVELLVCLAHSRVPAECNATYQPQKPSALNMLKARKFYSIRQFPVNLSSLTLATLFEYQDNFEAAARLLEENAAACDAKSIEREQTLQLFTELQHRHSTWHPGPKAAIRDFLDRASGEYPSNTQFLSTALWHHLQSGLRAPVYDLIARLTKPAGTVHGIVWSVWAEAVAAADLYAPGSGEASRVRTTLRRALASHAGRNCPSLWLRAIEFERLMGRPEAAKTLFFRGMSHVGSWKELYMIPFHQDLRASFTAAELTHIMEAMSNRGIRLRCEPSEFSVSLDVDNTLPIDEELEDDELMFLRDRQANKPY